MIKNYNFINERNTYTLILKNMKTRLTLVSAILCATIAIYAQEGASTEKQEIDASKPTNLYTQINTNLEGSFSEAQNLFGLRVNVSYAINPDNLILAEVPMMYNNRTEKFGISDTRIRYFAVIKRNISNRIIAIAPFTDITFPTGSFENGLGTSSWSIAIGSVFGIVATKKLALFPGVSYVYTTKPGTDLIPEDSKFAGNGIGLQFNASYSFSKRTFMFVNPTPLFINKNSKWETVWLGELNLNHIFIPNKLKGNIYWGPNFTNKIHVIRIGTTFYL